MLKMKATHSIGSHVDPLVMQSALREETEAASFDSVSDLVASLKKVARRGTRVETSPKTSSAQVRVDIVVSSPSDRIGVICDQADARKIHRQRSLLNEVFVDRVYLTSRFDAIMDPRSLAQGIAQREPGMFHASGEARPRSASRAGLAVVPSARRKSVQRASRSVLDLDRERSRESSSCSEAA